MSWAVFGELTSLKLDFTIYIMEITIVVLQGYYRNKSPSNILKVISISLHKLLVRLIIISHGGSTIS